MGVVSTAKVSNIFPIPQDTFQTKQAHLVWFYEHKHLSYQYFTTWMIIVTWSSMVKQTFFFLAPSFLWASKAALCTEMLTFKTIDFQAVSVPAKEVSVSLQLTCEEKSSLQWCVIHPHLHIMSCLIFTIPLIVQLKTTSWCQCG